jgi:cobalt/nickel transport protein
MKHWPYLIFAVALPILLATYIIVLGYTPLIEAVLTLPKETEILLFTIQAGIGAAVIGHFFGFRKGSKSRKPSTNKELKGKQKIDIKYLVLIGAVIALFSIPFVINPDAEFEGTDGQGPEVIEDSGYTPWIDPIGYEPDELGEIVLFSLQVAIGGAIIGYFVGYTRAKGR